MLATVGATIGLSGCAATQEKLEYSASPGSFAESAVEEAGYEALEREEIVETRNVEAAGQSKEVTVTNYAQPYQRKLKVGGQQRTQAAASIVTTPSISLVGQEVNPIGKESPAELMDRARGRIESQIDGGEIRDVSKVAERSLTVAEKDATVSVFEAVTEIEGKDITLRVHLTRVKHEGDFVLLAGGFPKQRADEERPRLETLFTNVNHPLE